MYHGGCGGAPSNNAAQWLSVALLLSPPCWVVIFLVDVIFNFLFTPSAYALVYHYVKMCIKFVSSFFLPGFCVAVIVGSLPTEWTWSTLPFWMDIRAVSLSTLWHSWIYPTADNGLYYCECAFCSYNYSLLFCGTTIATYFILFIFLPTRGMQSP